MMNWQICENKFIREVEIDNHRIKFIIEKAKQRKVFIESTEANEENVSFIVEGYYEIIKELLVAYLLKNGMRSKNHQCLITYFYKENPRYEGEAHLIAKLSYYRNRLNYYGESIPFLYYNKNKERILRTIEIIQNSLL